MITLYVRGILALLCCSAVSSAVAVELTVRAKGELVWSETENQQTVSKNWFNGGTGQLHYAKRPLSLGPQYLSLDMAGDSAISARVHAQWHSAPEAGVSVTEAWLNWAPLPVNSYRLRARLGYFYPQMSLENTDTAWTSPYSSTFSAINSWLAEEIRSRGAELSISRPGRFFQSKHSLTAVAGAFQGNDPAGTLLAWRGFALHNLQTGLGERVNFADYPSLQSGPLELQPAWVEPTRELDHRTGFYAGVHWQYLQNTRLRAYYYDNRADPLVISHQQYAWRTRFSSLAAQHVINDNWQLVAQWLDGDTLMGPGAVAADFSAWFVLLHWQHNALSASIRFDDFNVTDTDTTPGDDNNGEGQAMLLALSYRFSPAFSLSAEYLSLRSTQQNRQQQWSWPAGQRQTLTQLIATWRWQ